jgi:hypothetical protein
LFTILYSFTVQLKPVNVKIKTRRFAQKRNGS